MGFPIRRSPDQGLFNDSPELIAAGRVLHRLPAPRHPPYALSNLTIKFGQDKKAAYSIVKEPFIIYLIPPPGGLIFIRNGADRNRTGDLRRAKPALSQLSYSPSPILSAQIRLDRMVGLSGFEPLTSRLSGVRSNQLSYRPDSAFSRQVRACQPTLTRKWIIKKAEQLNLSFLHSFERR
jgi:hypothetical protein